MHRNNKSKSLQSFYDDDFENLNFGGDSRPKSKSMPRPPGSYNGNGDNSHFDNPLYNGNNNRRNDDIYSVSANRHEDKTYFNGPRMNL